MHFNGVIIGHFRITVPLAFFFKASLDAHLFIWKLVFICMWMKANFHMKRWAPELSLKKRPKVIRKGLLGHIFQISFVYSAFCTAMLDFKVVFQYLHNVIICYFHTKVADALIKDTLNQGIFNQCSWIISHTKPISLVHSFSGNIIHIWGSPILLKNLQIEHERYLSQVVLNQHL